nr:Rieske (2Fe-2S) protein [Thermoactinospora rubra]
MADTTRRAVVLGAGGAGLTALLAACSGYGQQQADTGATADPPAEQSPAATANPEKGEAKGDALASTDDIPVGEGKVFKEQKVVVTQPAAGEFKAFSATCTHQGCTVADVSNGTINCPCHGSKFKIEDGSVADGPATKPLPEKQITVEGNSILLS